MIEGVIVTHSFWSKFFAAMPHLNKIFLKYLTIKFYMGGAGVTKNFEWENG